MSETQPNKSASLELTISLEDFLTLKPPGKIYQIDVEDISNAGVNSHVARIQTLTLFCESTHCSKMCFFDASHSTIYINPNETKNTFLIYTCRHCKRTAHKYAVTFLWEIDDKLNQSFSAVKLGEWPPYGGHTPTKVNALIGSDRDLYFDGRRSEALGMGIGALTYYRRVVENQKNRIIDQIIKVCRTLSAGEAILNDLEDAKREIRFTSAIDKIKTAIPQVLLINGQNPLTLLHAALSEGVHDKTDSECLEIATSIRIVLSELAEWMAIAVKEESELSSAVKNLLKFKQPPTSAGDKS